MEIPPFKSEVINQNPIDDHEHIVDINSPEMREHIENAKGVFAGFLRDFGERLDFSDETSVNEVYIEAERQGIFQHAKEIRELIFDKNISVYGVSYLSNVCDEKCLFCPMGQSCIRTEAAKKGKRELEDELQTGEITDERHQEIQGRLEELQETIQRHEAHLKTLSPEEAKEDFAAVAEIGHQELCILSGSGLSLDYRKLFPYIEAAVNQEGIKEAILNLSQFREEIFQALMEDLQHPETGIKIPDGVKLQFRIFQETYDRDAYAYFMGKSHPLHGKGNKGNYDVKYNSQIVALRVGKQLESQGKKGIDEVGIGTLFGLTRFPLKEIVGLQKHTEDIFSQTGVEVKRCCLPFGNEPENSGVDIPYMIPGKFSQEGEQKAVELVYALARLAMPTLSIVNSERDRPELLEILDQYANHTTVFVHPEPGGNIEALKELQGQLPLEDKPIGQAEVYPRKPADAIKSWHERGYHVLGFNTQKYL